MTAPVHRMAILLLAAAMMIVARPEIRLDDDAALGRKRMVEILDAPHNLNELGPAEIDEWTHNAARRLELEGRAEGRLDAKAHIAVDRSHRRPVVEVRWEPGPAYYWYDIRVVAPTGLEVPEKLRILEPPEPLFRRRHVTQLLRTTDAAFLDKGFLDVTTTPDLAIDTLNRRVRLRISVAPGTQVVFGGIEVEGTRLVRREVVEDLWDVKTGNLVRASDINVFRRKLLRTGLFNSVQVDHHAHPSRSDLSVVRVRLQERVPGLLASSLIWEPVFGWGLEGEARHRNLGGDMVGASLVCRLSQRLQTMRLGWNTPLLLGTETSLELNLSLRQQSVALIDTTITREFAVLSEATLGVPVGGRTSLFLNLSTERVRKIPPVLQPTIHYRYGLVMGGRIDQRSTPFDPVRGWSLDARFGNSGEVDFDRTWSWVRGEGRAWVPLAGPLLSAFALEGGRFIGTTSLDGAGLFWLGGSRSVRSWRLASIRLEEPPGTPLSPRFVRVSAELRANAPADLQAVAFLDGARLWNRGSPSRLTNPHAAAVGYGLGLRWKISLLSLRVDWAFGRGDSPFSFDLTQAI